MAQVQRAASFVLVAMMGALLISTVSFTLLPFGTFPERQIGSSAEISVGQKYIEKAPQETGAANVVTSIVWGYRGYDTLGETTILFTAVVAVIMMFRTARRPD